MKDNKLWYKCQNCLTEQQMTGEEREMGCIECGGDDLDQEDVEEITKEIHENKTGD